MILHYLELLKFSGDKDVRVWQDDAPSDTFTILSPEEFESLKVLSNKFGWAMRELSDD